MQRDNPKYGMTRPADSDAADEGAEFCNVSKTAPMPESQHRFDL